MSQLVPKTYPPVHVFKRYPGKGLAGRTDRPVRSASSTRDSLRWQVAHRPADYHLGAGEPFTATRRGLVVLKGMENWQG